MTKTIPLELRVAALHAYDVLQEEMGRLRQALSADHQARLFLPWAPEGSDQRSLLASWLEQMRYRKSGDGRGVERFAGLAAVSERVCAHARAVNAAKDKLKDAMMAIRKVSDLGPGQWVESHLRDQGVDEVLRRAGLARINLKQAYRHIVVLEEPPQRVGFTWTTGKDRRRTISHAAASRHLQDPSELDDSLEYVHVASKAPALYANVWIGQTKRMHSASLPLLFPSVAGQWPEHNEPPQEPPRRSRLSRSDRHSDLRAIDTVAGLYALKATGTHSRRPFPA